MSDWTGLPRSYDAWRTAGPPEPPPMVCPKCGHDSEDMEELEVVGLDGYGLMKYPLRVTRGALGLKHDDPDELVSISGSGRAREFASRIELYRCPDCGTIVSDDGFVSRGEFYADEEPDDEYLVEPRGED
jgi:hypothetical protein